MSMTTWAKQPSKLEKAVTTLAYRLIGKRRPFMVGDIVQDVTDPNKEELLVIEVAKHAVFLLNKEGRMTQHNLSSSDELKLIR